MEHPYGKIIEKPVSTIDIMPTILDVLNISSSTPLEGSSLLPLVRPNSVSKGREYIYLEENLDDKFILKAVVQDNQWKYIFTEKSELRDVKQLGREELYNLMDDPLELNNLVKSGLPILEFLHNKLNYFQSLCEENAVQPSRTELDPSTLERLKALGYLK